MCMYCSFTEYASQPEAAAELMSYLCARMCISSSHCPRSGLVVLLLLAGVPSSDTGT